MNLSLSRRAQRRMRHRLGAYGLTAALGLFTAGGIIPQCAPPPPPATSVSNVQDAVVTSVNQHRANAGVRRVYIDSRLTRAAQDHANYMAQNQVMTHTGAGGTNAGQRISATGHRANILNGNMAHIGVAAAKGTNGVTYWTMVLANGG